MKTMAKVVAVIGLALVSYCPAMAQENPAWNKSADLNLAVTQNSYSNSWVGGEAGSASWVSNLNFLIEGPLAPKWISKSTAKLSFGQMHIQDMETKHWKKPVKSTDLIDLESTLRYLTGWFVDPYVALRLESEFLDASVPTVNRYINPMLLTESTGFTRRLYEKEKQFIDSRIGLAIREEFDRRVVDTAARTTKTTTTTDGGLESVTDVSINLHARIGWTSKLSIFKPLTVSDKTVPHWPAIHVNWENILAATVTKYITVNLYVQWLYDKPIDHRGRFKETLALGFTYDLM